MSFIVGKSSPPPSPCPSPSSSPSSSSFSSSWKEVNLLSWHRELHRDSPTTTTFVFREEESRAGQRNLHSKALGRPSSFIYVLCFLNVIIWGATFCTSALRRRGEARSSVSYSPLPSYTWGLRSTASRNGGHALLSKDCLSG